MKKITLCILATCAVLSVMSTQLNAATENNQEALSTLKSTDNTIRSGQITPIQSIDLPALSSSGNKEVLKESVPFINDQGGHSRKYQNRHGNRNVDVSIRADRPERGDGYYQGRHSHSGAYIGGGGLLVLIIILILVL